MRRNKSQLDRLKRESGALPGLSDADGNCDAMRGSQTAGEFMSSLLQRVTAVIAVFFLPGIATAWDSSFIAAPSLPSDFAPAIAAAPDAGGIWVGGTANDFPALVRYGADGSFKFVRYLSAVTTNQGYFQRIYALAPYPDGGVVEIDTVNQLGYLRCYLRRFDANGQLRWAIPGGSLPSPQSSGCLDTLQIDGAGNIWSLYDPVIAPDGTALSYVKDRTVNGWVLADPNSGTAYAYGCAGANYCLDAGSGQSMAAIQKMTPKGVVWTVQAPLGNGTTMTALDSLVIGSDGNLYGYGRQVAASDAPATLYGMSVTADGSLRWQQTYPGVAAGKNVMAAAGAGGQSLVLYGDRRQFLQRATDTAPAIAAVSPTGVLQWRHSAGFQPPTIAVENPYPTWSTLQIAANGDIVSALQYCDASGSSPVCPLQQTRSDASGNMLYAGKTVDKNNSAVMNFALLPDSSSLAIKGAAFRRLDRNGNTLAPPQTISAVSAASGDATVEIADDGSTYLLTTNASTNSYALTAYERNGLLRWRKIATAISANGGAWGYLIARKADVCFIGRIENNGTLDCYARDTGNVLKHVALPDLNTADLVPKLVAGDQLLALYQSTDGQEHHVLFDAQANLLHKVSLLKEGEVRGNMSVNANGTVLIQTSSTTLSKFDLDGSRAYTVPTDMSDYILRLAKDGSALLARGSPKLQLERLDDKGQMLWKSTPSLALTSTTRLRISSFEDSGNDAYLYVYNGASPVPGANPSPGSVVKLNWTSGEVIWSIAAPFPRSISGINSTPGLYVDYAKQRLLLLTSYSNKIELRNFSIVDGSEGIARNETVYVDQFSLWYSKIATDGALVLVNDTTDTVTGSALQVNTLSHPFDIPPPIRVDQPGIAGAWYSPYSTGQGFIVDYIAGNTTVFMPWFTFTRTQASGPSGNVWYTLQGQPGAGAKSVDLNIYVADSPGTFNSGKNGAKQVGTATLSFADCGHGSLRYQFDASTNDGMAGTITLTRLTPQASSCQLADGSTQAVSVNPPAQGFDARQSGSWYDTNTSGQGMELTVVPAGNGASGLLFGAWFTYDPAGAGNDPLNQQWFSLQGDLANAQGGKVTVPILQALGGTLDGLPTRNSSQVGTATLTFAGCDRVQVDYQFANTSVAHAYAGLSGSLHLTKLGGCATL